MWENWKKQQKTLQCWDLEPRGQEWIRRFPEVLFSPGFCSPEYDVRVVNSSGNHPIHSSSLSCSLGARLSNSFLKTSSDSRFPAYSVSLFQCFAAWPLEGFSECLTQVVFWYGLKPITTILLEVWWPTACSNLHEILPILRATLLFPSFAGSSSV